jgi:hypothetical protein
MVPGAKKEKQSRGEYYRGALLSSQTTMRQLLSPEEKYLARRVKCLLRLAAVPAAAISVRV